MDELLPIGSIVKVEKDTWIQLMIIGYYPFNEEDETIYHYTGVLYPYGIEDEHSFFVFNTEDITDVVFRGYLNEEGEKVIKYFPMVVAGVMNEE